MAEIVRQHLGPRAFKLFITFVWLSLVYVITAFTDITSASFVEPQYGGGVATSSTLGWETAPVVALVLLTLALLLVVESVRALKK